MVVRIDNEIDIKNFYRKLFWYKSFWYKKVYFETNSNDENIKLLIKGLNIKKRKKRITYVYDTCCDIIDNDTKGKNICGFKNCKCYTQYCNNYSYGCCRLCIYVTEKGCSSKNLACKLFNCEEVRKRYKVINYKDLKLLKLLSLRQRFIVKSDYFSSREEVLKDLYSYSIIYATIRIIYRIGYRFIKYRKL